VKTPVGPVIVLGFGTALVHVARGSALLRYVRPGVRPEVLVAGVAVGALAAVAVVLDRPERLAGQRRLAVSAVLLPTVLLLMQPPPLGAYSAARRPTVLTRTATSFGELRGPDPAAVSLSEVALRVIWGRSDSLRGHVLLLTGFVAARTDDGFELARLVITCCAADAGPVVVRIETRAVIPRRGSWLLVVATFVGTLRSDPTTPILRAVSMSPTRAPPDPYE
jgi:uncharacterized repeat protein (TIGR03943 family)